jgi:hypothetical protein
MAIDEFSGRDEGNADVFAKNLFLIKDKNKKSGIQIF